MSIFVAFLFIPTHPTQRKEILSSVISKQLQNKRTFGGMLDDFPFLLGILKGLYLNS